MSMLVMIDAFQVMHKVVMPHFDIEKPEEERTIIYGCENDHGCVMPYPWLMSCTEVKP